MNSLAGELVFIGLGLNDHFGISLRGQAEAKSCSVVFAEFYTSVMPNMKLDYLSGLVGKQVVVLSRSQVEEQAEKLILAEAKDKKVGFLVPGDPMTATTHVDLRLRAEKAGIKTRIIHGSSVLTAAAGATGLQSYKFGRTVTVPAFWEGAFPESVYLGIKSNLQAGLHSLVLLEVDRENNRFISIGLALKRLVESGSAFAEGMVNGDTLVVGMARLESPDMLIRAGSVSEVMQVDFGAPLYAVIFPGKLHFLEAEALRVFGGAKIPETS